MPYVWHKLNNLSISLVNEASDSQLLKVLYKGKYLYLQILIGLNRIKIDILSHLYD